MLSIPKSSDNTICIPLKDAIQIALNNDKKESGKNYYENNKKRIQEKQRIYRENNREKLREYNRNYRRINKDKLSERHREYQRKYREKQKALKAEAMQEAEQ